MDYTYRLLKSGMNGAMAAQSAIAQNLANINTHNYRASHVDFQKVLQQARSQKSANTAGPIVNNSSMMPTYRTGLTPNDSGNNVDLNLEMIEMSKNQLHYSGMAQQVNKKISIRKYVINGG
jgi:flagellar basal-body rod protein FlgB